MRRAMKTTASAVAVLLMLGSVVRPSPARASDGGVVGNFGTAAALGSPTGALNAPIVAMTSTPDGGGYWLLAADGGVFTFGDAPFRGSVADLQLHTAPAAIAASPDGRGYWILLSDGRVFTFGSAAFFGAVEGGDHLGTRFVAMSATPDGRGYWIVAADGRVFSFGQARFSGAIANVAVSVVGFAPLPDSTGYWLATSDGGIFTFGRAPFLGAAAGAGAAGRGASFVGFAATPDGRGYWLLSADGGIYAFGDAPFEGALTQQAIRPRALGLARASGTGYWILTSRAAPSPFTPSLTAMLDSRAGELTAAVEDLRSGERFVYHPGLALMTASTVKVQILGTLLAEAQAQGRSLSAGEQSLAASMIEVSNNTDASILYQAVGGAPAIQRFGDSLGMSGTTASPSWALTTTTATDQLTLLDAFARPNSVLTDASRAYGASLMSQVIQAHRFGVTGGIDPAAVQAIKTGRLPGSGVINGIAWISGSGRDYLIAIFAQGEPSDAYALVAMDAISSATWAALG